MAEVSLPSVMIMYSLLRYVNTFTAEVMTCSLPVWLAFKGTKSRAGQFFAIIINYYLYPYIKCCCRVIKKVANKFIRAEQCPLYLFGEFAAWH